MPLTLKAGVKEVQDLSILAARAFFRSFHRPYYFRDILEQMDRIGVGSVIVVMLTGFFTGSVLTLQSAKSLAAFGAKGLTSRLVAISLVRELGPVLSALMLAGRVGSGIASELGSMVVTEQINAMRALGTDPVKKLVVPRIVATTFMLPLLTVVANAIGLFGGLFIAVYVLLINGNVYMSSAWNGLDYVDVFGGLLKPLVFGAIVSVVGCHCGLRTHGGTQGVGQSTTQAVVAASVLILFFNLILTRVFWPPS